MTTDSSRVECTLHNDARLIAAIDVIVSHAAERGGLSGQAQEDLAAAVSEGCREAFRAIEEQGDDGRAIKLLVAGLAGRVEVTIEYPGETLPATGFGKPALDKLVDRAQYETHEGHCRMTLIKYCGAVKSKPRA